MVLNASSFIQNRTQVIAITNDRIKHILWYVAECYNLLQKDKPTYSKAIVKASTSHKFEDYLKIEFVDNYLIENKAILQSKVSHLEQINFSYETQKKYVDSNDGKNKPDKIDIYINKLGLQNEWKEHDEHVYFALECKRIVGTKSYLEYISDIRKFTERDHTNLRLPFEGMIGFIEDASINSTVASNELSKKLKASTTIETTQYLTSIILNTEFDGSYLSVHKKDYKPKDIFTLYHLLFDYSKNVTA